GTVAARARIGDDLPVPRALAARLRDREEALLEADLARAVALRAGLGGRAGLGATAAARLAASEARQRQCLLAAAARLHERDGELVLEVGAAPRGGPPAARPSRPEEVAEEVAQDVVEAAEVEATRTTVLEGGVAEPVVLRAAPRVGEDLIGLVDLLEALLGL